MSANPIGIRAKIDSNTAANWCIQPHQFAHKTLSTSNIDRLGTVLELMGDKLYLRGSRRHLLGIDH